MARPAGWSVKLQAIQHLITPDIPCRALAQYESVTYLEQMQENCTSLLPCLPPRGTCRPCRRLTFRNGYLTLRDKHQGLRGNIRLVPSQLFAFSKLTCYKEMLTKGKERHKDKIFQVPLSSLNQKQNSSPPMQLSHWGKDERKSKSRLQSHHLMH